MKHTLLPKGILLALALITASCHTSSRGLSTQGGDGYSCIGLMPTMKTLAVPSGIHNPPGGRPYIGHIRYDEPPPRKPKQDHIAKAPRKSTTYLDMNSVSPTWNKFY